MAYRYTVEVSHKGLGKVRIISGTDRDLVQAKARAQVKLFHLLRMCHVWTLHPNGGFEEGG